MKKTIIALFALAGVTQAATLATIDTEDSNLVSYINFNTSSSPNAGGITYTNAATYHKDGYGIISATSNNMYTNNAPGAGFTSAQSFTLSFDVRSFGKGDLFSLTVNNGDDWKKIMLTTGSDDTSLMLKFYGTGDTVNTEVAPATRTDWTTITLVGDTSITSGVKLYVDGTYKGALDMDDASNWNNDTIGGFQFGSSFAGMGTTESFVGNAEIDNVLVYNRAFSAAEVKALTVASVPEPTTATLSLLALAGLAARRRRCK